MSRRTNLEELMSLVKRCETSSRLNYNYKELKDFISNELTTLDTRAAKARAHTASKGDDLTERVREVLVEDYATIDDIVEALNDPEATRGRVQYRLNKLAETGEICKATVIVSTDDNGKNARTAIAYCLRERE